MNIFLGTGGATPSFSCLKLMTYGRSTLGSIMHFPIEVWRTIKEYSVPYRAYWARRMTRCIEQFETSDYLARGIKACQRKADARRCARLEEEGLDPLESLWWRTQCAHLQCAGIVHSRGFVYYRYFLYWPDGIRRRTLTGQDIRNGRRAKEIMAPRRLPCIANY